MSLSDDRPFVLGLTGGIGTGKSTAAEYIAGKGFLHVDADAISRALTRDGSPVVEELDQIFGPEGPWGEPGRPVLLSEGVLDRRALAELVFHDPEKKARLDEFMFGRIIARIESAIEEADQPVLLDAPLLFEAGLQRLCHRVILLTADEKVRIDRLLQRDDTTKEEIRARIRNQMRDEEKAALADVTVDNSGSLAELYAGLDRALRKLAL